MTKEDFCPSCGKRILLRSPFCDGYGDSGYKRYLCPDCLADERRIREEKRAAIEGEKRALVLEVDRRKFSDRLNEWKVVKIDDIRPDTDNVLYIVGNGFDLMHRLPSSYYHFRDSMGRNNPLRRTLETYIAVDDVWDDFEDSLAHADIDAMTSYSLLDGLLDTFDAYDEDSGAAEYYMSVEAAVSPINTIATSLPSRFSEWVDTLKVGTDDRPLKNLIVGGRVLDFNYTEFVETLYGVPRDNVCYVHGCRRERKSSPLILGHLPDKGGGNRTAGSKPKWLRGYRRALAEAARNNALDYISECDATLTKDTDKIIKSNAPFFSELSDLTMIIAIGHSYSATDAAYYIRIKESLSERNSVRWIFGCYGLRDLDNLEKLLPRLGLKRENVTIFRTDTVVTTPNAIKKDEKSSRPPREKVLCRSSDGTTLVSKCRNSLIISEEGREIYEIETFTGIKSATFVSGDSRLLVILRGLSPGVLLYDNKDGWHLTGELTCDHQHLLVPRLKKVFLTDRDLTFVYNNRVRKYSLADASLIYNRAVKNAPSASYDGVDVTTFFNGDR